MEVPQGRLPGTPREDPLHQERTQAAHCAAGKLSWWWQASDEAGSYMLVEVCSQSKLVSVLETNDNVVWGNIIPNSSS